MTDTVGSTDLQDKLQEVTGKAQETAQQVVSQGSDVARQQIDTRSTDAGETATSVSEAARHASAELRDRGQDIPAQIIDQAAERVERLGVYLRDSNADRILRDAEEFGRKQPWAVIAGGIVLGFAASRVLKASSSRRYNAQQSGGAGSLSSSGVDRPMGSSYLDDPQLETYVAPASAPPPPPASTSYSLDGRPLQ